MGIGSSRQRRQNNVTYATQQQQQQYAGPFGHYPPPPPVYPGQRQQQALPPPGTPGLDGSMYPAQYVTNGQMYQQGWRSGSGYAPYSGHPPPPAPYPPQQDQSGRRTAQPAAPAQEFTQTATIRNCVNLKKETIKLTPLADDPTKLQISFAFDASSACIVTTFVRAAEEPMRFKLTTRTQPAAAAVVYKRGLAQKFPKPAGGRSSGAGTHVVDLSLNAEGSLGSVEHGECPTYPLVIRLEALTEDGVKEGRTLEELAPGHEQRSWVQSQTTYATIARNEEGEYEVRVIEQKIWVKGVSYKLQEIYGMDSAAAKGSAVSPEDAEERLCVICLSNERDTTVLPCRHMCMCKDCAQELSKQTSKCPICRNNVDSLLHIKVQRKSRRGGSSSGGAAAGAAPASGAPAAQAAS